MGRTSRRSKKVLTLLRPRQVSDLVEIADVDGQGNVGRIAVVEEMLQTDLHGNAADHLAEARHLEVLHFPDVQHQRAELRADEAQAAMRVQIDAVEVACLQGLSKRRIGRGKCIEQIEQIGQISPQYFLLVRSEARRRFFTLLDSSRAIVGLKRVILQLFAKPVQTIRSEIVAQKL